MYESLDNYCVVDDQQSTYLQGVIQPFIPRIRESENLCHLFRKYGNAKSFWSNPRSYLRPVLLSIQQNREIRLQIISNKNQWIIWHLCSERGSTAFIYKKLQYNRSKRRIQEKQAVTLLLTQLSIRLIKSKLFFTLQYVKLNEETNINEVQERFRDFVDCNQQTKEAIANMRKETLKRWYINLRLS